MPMSMTFVDYLRVGFLTLISSCARKLIQGPVLGSLSKASGLALKSTLGDPMPLRGMPWPSGKT